MTSIYFHFQLVLNSDFRITKQTLLHLVKLVCADRHQLLNGEVASLQPSLDFEDAKFWTHGDLNILESILNYGCECSDSHLLSPNPCSQFIKRMKAIDYCFAQMIINKIVNS